MFKLYRKSKKSQARLGTLSTKYGQVRTPVFMTIATKAAVKALTVHDLQRLHTPFLLANTYHLYLRPGEKLIRAAGGLHNFMGWSGPILTDSGGYQVFSLAGTKHRRGNLVKIKSGGVEFSSHTDGSRHYFTPARVLSLQRSFGSDIAMLLDVCTANPSSYEQAAQDVSTTIRWARASQVWRRRFGRGLKVFAIVQGSTYTDLRRSCARELVDMNFDGYAVGGLAVGETAQEMYRVLAETVPMLPEKKPRYLMGVGRPENILQAVRRGIDMFDCVIPTREARHGRLYVWRHRNLRRRDFYRTTTITRSSYARDRRPLNKASSLPELRDYTWGYLHHLFRSEEPLAIRLATLYNVEFYLQFMEQIRNDIRENRW